MGIITSRRRVCGGKSLPYDYEVEWIGTEGNVGFLTNYIPNSFDLTIRGIFYFGGYTNNASWVLWWGSYTGGSEPSFRIIRNESNNNTVFPYNGEKGNRAEVTLPVNVGQTYNFTFEPYLYKWNNLTYKHNQTGVGNNTVALSIFSSRFIGKMIGHFILNKGSDLAAEFIPVVKNGVGCIYDAVTNKLFYNTLSGTPTIGPRV